jgi:hypothetical protein
LTLRSDDGKVITMTMTNRYDSGNPNHTVTCSRLACSAPDVPVHEAGRHLDQRSPFYDGPDTLLTATSVYVRESARKIVREAPALTAEVVDLVTYLEHMRGQVAAAHVDRDRGIRAASERALDCQAHGEVIKALEDQVAAFDRSARNSEAGRLAALGFLFAVDEVLNGTLLPNLTVADLVAALKAASKRAHAAHDRAWKS